MEEMVHRELEIMVLEVLEQVVVDLDLVVVEVVQEKLEVEEEVVLEED